jgi:phospholipase D1/2
MINSKVRINATAQGIIIVVALLGCAAAWHWTPLSYWVNFETVAAWEQSIKADSSAPYIIVGAYLLAGLVLFPITLLTAVTIFTFGPVAGNIYSLIGWLLSATLGYGMGRLLGRDWLRTLLGDRLSCLNHGTERSGVLAVLALRIVPVAPFTVVNLFIGASHIRFRDFTIGSLLGRIPGLLALTLFEVQLKSLMRAPAMGKLAFGAAIILCAFLGNRWLCQQFASAKQPIVRQRNTTALPGQ